MRGLGEILFLWALVADMPPEGRSQLAPTEPLYRA